MSSSAIKAGRAFVEVGILDRVDAGLSRVQAKLNQFGSWVTGAGAKMLAVGTAGAAAFLPTIKAASDAQEAWNKFQAVFGPLTQAANGWATAQASAVNRSAGEVRKAMSMYQAFFVGMGFDRQQALKLTEQISALALDLASFHNIADDDAYGRLIAALSGSSEVLDQFGINIKQAALEAELLKKGLKWSQATEAEKSLARIAVITRAMTDQGAMGDAAKTSGSFANRLKGLQGAASELSTTIGTALLPPLTELLDKFTIGIRLADQFAKNHGTLIQAVAAGAAGIAGLGGSMVGLGAATRLTSVGLTGVRVALSPLRSVGGMFRPLTGGLGQVATTAGKTRGLLRSLASLKVTAPNLGIGKGLAGSGAAILGVGSRTAAGAAGLGGKALSGGKELWRSINLPRRSLDSVSLGKRALISLASPLLMIGEAAKVTRQGFGLAGKELAQQFPRSARATTAAARGTLSTLTLLGRATRATGRFAGPTMARGALGTMRGGARLGGGLLGMGANAGLATGMAALRTGLLAAGALLSPTGLLVGGAAALTLAIVSANGGVDGLTGGLQSLVSMTGGLGEAATTSFDAWRTNGAAAVDSISAAIEQGDYARAWEVGTSAMSASWAATVDAFSGYWAPFVAGFETHWQNACDLFNEGVEGLKALFGPAVSWLGEQWNSLVSNFTGNDGLSDVALTWADISASVATVITNTWYGIQDTFNTVVSGIRSGWSTATEFLVDKWFSATGWIQKAFVKLRGMFDKNVNVEAEITRIDQEAADRKAENANMGQGQQDDIAAQKAARAAEIAKNRSDVTDAIEARRERQRETELERANQLKADAAAKAKTEQDNYQQTLQAAEEKKVAIDQERATQQGAATAAANATRSRSAAAGQSIVQLASTGGRVGLQQQQFGVGKSMDKTADNTGKMVEAQKQTNKLLEDNQQTFT